MNLAENIKKDTITAMKNKDNEKVATLRLLVSELEKKKVDNKLSDVSKLSNDDITGVITSQIKKLDKEIEAYENVGRGTEAQETEKELLKSYLPKQATEEEIREHAYRADSMVRNREIKNAMQYLSKELKGKADMKLVSKISKEVSKEKNESNG